MRLIFIAVLLASACGPLNVSAIEPRPNVALMQKSDRTLELSVAAAIKDAFSLPPHNGIPVDTNVQSWRGTLNSGFRNAFGGYYELAGPGLSDLRLELERADLVGRPPQEIKEGSKPCGRC